MSIYVCQTCGKKFNSVYAEAGHRKVHYETWENQKNAWKQNREAKEKLYHGKKNLPVTTFLDNKYANWYYNIIESARQNPRQRPYEEHHILPRCMGGSDDITNLIRLSPREHVVCHILLTKMVPVNTSEYYKLHKAVFGINRNGNGLQRRLNTRLIMNAKVRFRKLQSERMKSDINPTKNKKWMSHIDLRISKIVAKNEVQQHLDEGYILRRIKNFDEYIICVSDPRKPRKNTTKIVSIRDIEAKKEREAKLKEMKDERRRMTLYLHEKYMNSDLSLRDFAKQHYDKSHVSLFLRFNKEGLIIKNKK